MKKELRKLFKSMDFISNKFLADEKADGKDFQLCAMFAQSARLYSKEAARKLTDQVMVKVITGDLAFK